MNKKPALVFYSQLKFRDIELDLVKHIKKNKEYFTIFVVNTKETQTFYQKNFPNSADKIFIYFNENELLEKKISKKIIIEKAVALEKKMGMTINRAFLLDRTIGRGFHASGGFNHPKVRLAEKSPEDIIKIAIGYIEFWDNIFKKYNVKLAMNLPQIGMRVSKTHNILTKNLAIAKFGRRLYWTSNVNYEPDNLIEFYNRNKKKNLKQFIPKEPQFNHLVLRGSDIKGFEFFNTVKVSSITLLQRVYGYLKGYRKSKNIHAFSEFRYIWRKRRDFISLRKNVDINLQDLEKSDIKYIYFPLATEPEVAMHSLAEDFFFQLSAINMLSRDLPANYKIIVKEHLFAVGRRPDNFYKQIKELKNVLMSDPLEYGISYLKRAQAVALVVGTSGWEAAAMGVPVITFTKHNSYNFLEHVFTVRDPDDTKEILNKICHNKFPTKKSIRDGAKMHDSYLNLSFDFEKAEPFQNWNTKKNNNYTSNFISNIYKKLKL
ncbi:hypothetical protein OAP55_00405 [Alphaproteobacteria bacterium]|nr:hypothetical protein [Alphaproteobacteria bacterium]